MRNSWNPKIMSIEFTEPSKQKQNTKIKLYKVALALPRKAKALSITASLLIFLDFFFVFAGATGFDVSSDFKTSMDGHLTETL